MNVILPDPGIPFILQNVLYWNLTVWFLDCLITPQHYRITKLKFKLDDKVAPHIWWSDNQTEDVAMTDRQPGIAGLLSLGNNSQWCPVVWGVKDANYSWLWWPKCQTPRPRPTCMAARADLLPCVALTKKLFPPLSLKQWHFWQSLSRKYLCMPLSFMRSEPTMFLQSHQFSILNHQIVNTTEISYCLLSGTDGTLC